jgi:methionyl-tRNA formyltransferase
VLEKEHGRLDFRLPAPRLAARIRGFQPWPGAFTSLHGRALKVHAARAAPPAGLAPGSARGHAEGILVGCGQGTSLLLAEVQLEGKRRVPAADFLKGHPIAKGTVLGP